MDRIQAPLTARARMAGAALVVALGMAGCAQPPGGVAGAGDPTAGGTGLTWPFAGMGNPFSRPAVDADLRGQIGGPVDTSGAGGGVAAGAAGGAVRDPFAGQGVLQPAVVGGSAATAAGAGSTIPSAAAPARSHTVAAGETAWAVSRKYGVSVADLAAANALSESMAIRTGQQLTIPPAAGGEPVRVAVTAPGVGSPTPQPPSASRPLPAEQTVATSTPIAKPDAPDLGKTRTAASGSGRFSMPVQGSIIRAYEKGKNEGIDISAAPGTSVKAAAAGTVAAITRDTDGVPIVVLRHDGTLMTVYAGLDGLTVGKGDSVSAGQTLGKTTAAGVVHFEVRRGFESVDPVGLLG